MTFDWNFQLSDEQIVEKSKIILSLVRNQGDVALLPSLSRRQYRKTEKK